MTHTSNQGVAWWEGRFVLKRKKLAGVDDAHKPSGGGVVGEEIFFEKKKAWMSSGHNSEHLVSLSKKTEGERLL